MPRLLRHILVCLGAVFVFALQTHSVASNTHRIQHALEFPQTVYAVDVDHDHGHEAVDHEQSGDETAPALTAVELDGEDVGGPVKHHHHSGGDVHATLVNAAQVMDDVRIGSLDLGPAVGHLPPGMAQDEPSDPPKQQRA